jgi:hypothetical protein
MRYSRLLFGSAVFLASFLLFLVEPIAAKQILPSLGGSAAVWITCLVFFQTALLVAYLYAHWLALRSHWKLHFVLLLLAVVSAIAWSSQTIRLDSTHPVTSIFLALGVSIGLPFLMLGATSPLLQVWLARLEARGIPYRLFALSNLASLLALAAYPTLVEPHFTLRMQRLLWCCGFALFVLIAGMLTWRTRSATLTSAPAQDADECGIEPTPLRTKMLWMLLPMGAAMQLSAITAYLTANVAAIPLLWVLPLGVYLLTLILAFQFRVILPWGIIARLMVVLLGGLAYSLSKTNAGWPLWLSILFFLAELFFACIFLHSAAVGLKPQRISESTLFYLLFAAGGALGSFCVGIALPMVLRYNLDLPITFMVTALLALLVNWRGGWSQRMLWLVASGAMVVLVFWVRTAYQRDMLAAVRNFYATLRVTQNHSYPGATVRTLSNGSIEHGTQIFGTEELRHTPTTYYAPDSGVGLALRFCCAGRPKNVGVVGLGAGTIAAYGRPGDRIRFYDINPAVEPIARNVFTYIRDSGAHVDVLTGDARKTLEQSTPQNFDVLVLDAFSGDAIPVHLLTKEALDLYRRHLAPGGIIAFHVSNRHINLGPPIGLLADSAGMQARVFETVADENGGFASPGEYGSTWILVSMNQDFFEIPEVRIHAQPVRPKAGLRVWTDDYSAVLPVLGW